MNTTAKEKAKVKIANLRRNGATKDEARTIVMNQQFVEIDKLNQYLTEAIAAMDQSEADRFFEVALCTQNYEVFEL